MIKKTLKEYCYELEVSEDWRNQYKKFVPQFIEKAKTMNDWQEWDKDIFHEFFERSQGQCVSSLKQGYFTKEEKEKIKFNWNQIAPLLKTIAENQENPDWKTYKELKNKIRKYTTFDRRAATNRLVASLQPNLISTIVSESDLEDLIKKINTYTNSNISLEGDWFERSYEVCKLFQKELEPENQIDIITYPWQLLEHLRYINSTSMDKQNQTEPFLELLKASKNIILTGAPGTGKTFLAKQIAKQMIGVQTDEELEESEQFDFIQFHPSYDYTDFVEGLRPTPPDENGIIGFEIKDGIFKSFCQKASQAKFSEIVDNFDESWENLLSVIRNGIAQGTLTRIGSWDYGLSSKDSLKYSSVDTPSQYSFTITKKNVYDAYQGKQARPSGAFQKDMEDVVNYLKNNFGLLEFVNKEDKINNGIKNYVFVIDEINRGEISKIFGELFFSIDPSYRGKKGAVKTQYSNLHDDEKEVFYVPENVYIIGSMNDIDRSVESFDFAMRRRFTWIEITAEQSAENMNLPEGAKSKMAKLNEQISQIDGLNPSYHIGAAYFLDSNGNARQDYDNIWNLRIEPLLKEYLRGTPDSFDKIELLKNTFTA